MTGHNSKFVLSFHNKLKIREYAEGFRLYDIRCGKSAGREVKATLFFFLAMAMLFVLMQNNFNIAELPVCAVVLLICMYMCSYFIYILPNMAKLKGEHIYKSSKLLSKDYSFEIYKEYFVMKNEYESLKRYYTELSDCIETDDIFLLIGGMEKRVIVISKRCLEDSQSEKLSHFFQREMVRQYRRTKSRRRKVKK